MDGRTTMGAVLAVVTLAFAAGLAWSDGDGESPGESAVPESVEVSEYQGLPLDTFFREYDNSIKGPQNVDVEIYRLEIEGLVEESQSLKYDEVLALGSERRLVTLHCVEGWRERLLFEGVGLEEILAKATPLPVATTLVLHAADGYSTSLPYEDVKRLDLMLASRINGRVLDEIRGFPFQLVAESKLGYKWIKWVTRIELSDTPYVGFWERRGYPDDADVPERRLENARAPQAEQGGTGSESRD